MAKLSVQLFNHFQALYNDQPLPALARDRFQALLVYLLLQHGQPVARRTLAFTFWPDSTDEQARTNLRVLLTNLRKALEPPNVLEQWLIATHTTLQWQVDNDFTCDVLEFETALAQAKAAHALGDGNTTQQALERAVALYTGELLPACYDDWIVPLRDRLHKAMQTALGELITLFTLRGDYTAALDYAQRAISHEPTDEAAHLQLIHLHLHNSDRASALRAYRHCTTTLLRELNVEPGPALQALYNERLQTPPALVLTAATSSLVDREVEWEQLLATWQRSRKGELHLVLLSGEAGIGKTRLAEALLDWAERQRIHTARAQCYAMRGALSYAPLVSWLRTPVIAKAVAGLAEVWLSEVARLLPELHNQRPALPRLGPITQGWQRQRLFEALAQALLANQQPLLLWLDDLQWCDDETLDWLHFLLHHASNAPVLLLAGLRTSEPGQAQTIANLRLTFDRTQQLTEIALARLNATATTTLAVQTAGHPLAPTLLHELYQQTEGNPLFIVETVRAGLSRGVGEKFSPLSPPFPPSFPPKVQAMLEYRLNQLTPDARTLAGLAATIGRAFNFSVLVTASDLVDARLVQALDELVERQIIREGDADIFDFSHDKLREVAYRLLSQPRKRLCHRQVAQALVQVYRVELDKVAAQVAFHYEHAGAPATAIAYYGQAAQVAQRLSAQTEAVAHWQRALTLLRTLPTTPERDQQELQLLLPLGVVLSTARRFRDPEVEQIFTIAQTLSERMADPVQRFLALRGLCDLQSSRLQLTAYQSLGNELVALAQQLNQPELLVLAYSERCIACQYAGEITECLNWAEQAQNLYRPEMHQFLVLHAPYNPMVATLACTYTIIHVAGYTEQAQAKLDRAIELANRLAHPPSQIFALSYAAVVSGLLGDPHYALTMVERGKAIAAQYGHSHALALIEKARASALIQLGQVEAGIAILRQQLFNEQGVIVEAGTPYFLIMLASALAQKGEFVEAHQWLDETSHLIEMIGGRLLETAELHRVRGEVYHQQHEIAKAEEALHTAIAIAQTQGSRWLELRATLNLCRLRRDQGRRSEAQATLAALYGWFSEGFDQPDLQAARALLAELENNLSSTK